MQSSLPITTKFEHFLDPSQHYNVAGCYLVTMQPVRYQTEGSALSMA